MKWYLIQTKTNSEKFAVSNLKNQGFTCWYPEYEKIITHARKKQKIKKPLFPSYIFIKMNLENIQWSAINYTPGVKGMITYGGKPAILGDKYYNQLINMLNKDGLFEYNEMYIGKKVKIISGPFLGMVGKIDRIDAKSRVRILLDILGNNIKSTITTDKLASA